MGTSNRPHSRTIDVSAATMLLCCGISLAGCHDYPRETHTAILEAGGAAILDGKSLYFLPLGDYDPFDDFYGRIVRDIEEFPVDPSAQSPIDFTEGDPFVLVLPAGVSVRYYGTSYTRLYVGGDGVVGFGEPGGGNRDLVPHFSIPQISLLPVDASDDAPGSATYGVYDDSVVITFDNVDESSVQLELFIGGEMRDDLSIAYPVVSPGVAAGVVGLSNGQLRDDSDFLYYFVNSDLTSSNTGYLE